MAKGFQLMLLPDPTLTGVRDTRLRCARGADPDVNDLACRSERRSSLLVRLLLIP
jgi:hypothetical protein